MFVFFEWHSWLKSKYQQKYHEDPPIEIISLPFEQLTQCLKSFSHFFFFLQFIHDGEDRDQFFQFLFLVVVKLQINFMLKSNLQIGDHLQLHSPTFFEHVWTLLNLFLLDYVVNQIHPFFYIRKTTKTAVAPLTWNR